MYHFVGTQSKTSAFSFSCFKCFLFSLSSLPPRTYVITHISRSFSCICFSITHLNMLLYKSKIIRTSLFLGVLMFAQMTNVFSIDKGIILPLKSSARKQTFGEVYMTRNQLQYFAKRYYEIWFVACIIQQYLLV